MAELRDKHSVWRFPVLGPAWRWERPRECPGPSSRRGGPCGASGLRRSSVETLGRHLQRQRPSLLILLRIKNIRPVENTESHAFALGLDPKPRGASLGKEPPGGASPRLRPTLILRCLV